MRIRASISASLVLAAALAGPAPVAAAQSPGLEPLPIPDDPLGLEEVPEFLGAPAVADPEPRLRIPRHPFMAANGRSNIHDDAYMSDTYNRPGPLGVATAVDSALFARECASITFDGEGRLVTICVGLDRPVLAVLDPATLSVLAAKNLPPRRLSLNPFRDFTGGGYFYLDDRDRVVAPTSAGHVVVIAVEGAGDDAALRTVADHDVSAALAGNDDGIISVLPDDRGRLWFATVRGGVGVIGGDGAVRSLRLDGEGITNSFAVDPRGGVFIVTDAALYRFDARRGKPRISWRQPYRNTGAHKPGQSDAGSGTTPTLIGRHRVAITDNADPINVAVYLRDRRVRGRRLVCREPVFEAGASATDQSLIATRRSIVAENNHGYTGPLSVLGDRITAPGLQRVDLDRDGRGCRTVWRSDEISPSAVPKLSLPAGLIYTYTRSEADDDAWYLTAVDFQTGETVFERLAGTGFGHNNNFAPITIGPDGAAYIGVLGGLVSFRDSG